MNTLSEDDADRQNVMAFMKELRSFNAPQLTMGKVVLAYHLAHPEHAMAPDLRAKLRVALLAMSEEGLISIAEHDWDEHCSDCLPRSILLLSPTNSR